MEQIFFVKNGDLSEVNKRLQKGGRIKFIQAIGEPIHNGANTTPYSGTGDIYAYIVVEFD
jgi:hypothetical protein